MTTKTKTKHERSPDAPTSKELLERIERGIESFTTDNGEAFKRYLRFAARLRGLAGEGKPVSYSFQNTLLILMQFPEATQVAGYHTWRKLGNPVAKGAKAIRILAPIKISREDKNGEEKEFLWFKVVSVFDVSQTEAGAAALPNIAVHTLQGNDGLDLLSALMWVAGAEGLSVETAESLAPRGVHAGANGYYQRNAQLIWLSPGLPGATMAAKTLAHELSHHFAEHEANAHTRPEAETIAEASAFIVLNAHGLDSAEYSFGYLASWGNADAKLFKQKLAEIQNTARTIIDRTQLAPEVQAAIDEAMRTLEGGVPA